MRRELVNPRWNVVHDAGGGVVLKVVVLGSRYGAVDIRFDNHIARELADRLIQVSGTRAADPEGREGEQT